MLSKNLFVGRSCVSVKHLFIYFFPVLILIGSFFSLLIPPFQSPDEEDHLKRAYFLSQARIVMETPAGQSTGGLVDSGLNEFIASHRYMTGNQQKKLTLDVKRNASTIKWANEEEFVPCPGVNYYFPLIYSPQAIGLLIGKALDLTVSQSYYLSRYMALLSSLIIILIAFSIRRPSMFTIAMLLMPLTIFQFVSTSQDGFALALVILAGTLFLEITSKKYEFNVVYFYLMCGSILLLSTSRINLVPMLIMPFAATYFACKSVRHYLISAVVTLLSLAWILYAVATTVDNRVETGASTVEILTYYLKDPFAFIGVLINTLQDDRTVYFYIASFVGVLGWLDVGIGDVYTNIIFCSLLVIFLFSISRAILREEVFSRSVLVLVAIASFLLTFFLLLITWNKHPAEIIQGVQGRYFWASFIFLGLSMTNAITGFSSVRKWIISLALTCIFLVSVCVTPQVLLYRYFLSSMPSQIELPPLTLEEKAITVHPKDASVDSESGGFIDASEYKNGEIIITGWGYFDRDEKVFLTNGSQSFAAKYITIERPDVVNAMGNNKFIYAGFEMRISAETKQVAEKMMEVFCLYSDQKPYGIKEIVPGGSNKLYKCGLNK
jgi:uncharacterized membrane protein